MDKTEKLRTVPVHEEEPAKEEAASGDDKDGAQGQEGQAGPEKADAAKLKDQLLRVSAEFENYKKRAEREMAEFRKYANESLIKDLLPIADNLARAIESAGDAAGQGEGPLQKLLEGVAMTHGDVHKVLERHGVTPVEALGQAFDPAYHQALMTEASEEHAENMVVREMQRGYKMKDRLIRPALVVVSRGGKEKQA